MQQQSQQHQEEMSRMQETHQKALQLMNSKLNALTGQLQQQGATPSSQESPFRKQPAKKHHKSSTPSKWETMVSKTIEIMAPIPNGEETTESPAVTQQTHV